MLLAPAGRASSHVASANHLHAGLDPPPPSPNRLPSLPLSSHLSEGTVLEKKGMPDSWGLLAAGLIRGTCAVAATPAAATVAPEQMSPMTATAGRRKQGKNSQEKNKPWARSGCWSGGPGVSEVGCKLTRQMRRPVHTSQPALQLGLQLANRHCLAMVVMHSRT